MHDGLSERGTTCSLCLFMYFGGVTCLQYSDKSLYTVTMYICILIFSQGWEAHFRLLKRQADFHLEIRIARLPNQTQDKLKG